MIKNCNLIYEYVLFCRADDPSSHIKACPQPVSMIELREIAHTIEEYTVMNDYLAVRAYYKCILGCRLYVNIDLLCLKDLSHRGQLSKFFEMGNSYLFINCPFFFSIWSLLISFCYMYNLFLWDGIHKTSQVVHKSKKFLKI